MAAAERVATAIGQPLAFGKGRAELANVKIGAAPVVFQAQTFGYIPLDEPEELKQWEEDLRNFYGISVDGSALAGRATCETCSCCTDDCGLLE
jgi:hypothetical protein